MCYIVPLGDPRPGSTTLNPHFGEDMAAFYSLPSARISASIPQSERFPSKESIQPTLPVSPSQPVPERETHRQVPACEAPQSRNEAMGVPPARAGSACFTNVPAVLASDAPASQPPASTGQSGSHEATNAEPPGDYPWHLLPPLQTIMRTYASHTGQLQPSKPSFSTTA